MREFFKKLTALTIVYWKDRQSRHDMLRLLCIVLLTIGNVYLAIQFNEWKNLFYNALEARDYIQLKNEILRFCKLAAINIVVSMYIFYLEQIVILNWRRFFSTHFISEWLRENNHYNCILDAGKIDNPDQRIGEDIRWFIEKITKFFFGLLNALLTFVVFVDILWSLSGAIPVEIFGISFVVHGYIVWGALAYSFLGTWITYLLGRKLSLLNNQQQSYEADFRYAMMRVKEYAEQIALYGGNRQEGVILNNRLSSLLANFFKIVCKERQLTGFKAGYLQSSSIIPVLFGVPLYLNNTIKLGGLMQGASAFSRVSGSLSYFVMVYMEFAEWQACVNRLYDFMHHLQTIDDKNLLDNRRYIRGKYLCLENVTVYTPDSKKILYLGKFAVEQGRHTLINGKNGCGKTTLFRCFAGIWPYYTGRICVPDRSTMFFLSQKPYLPLGTLGDSIVYPTERYNAARDYGKIVPYLEYFHLDDLADKLDREGDWGNILSLGEQQKIAVIRSCLQGAQWLFLDEATSGMDSASIQLTYELLQKQEVTFVTTAHTETLKKYHKQFIQLPCVK